MCTRALHPSRAPLAVRHLPERPPQLPAIYSRSRRTVMRTPSVFWEVVGKGDAEGEALQQNCGRKTWL